MIRRIVMIRGTNARARRELGLLLGLALVLALGTGCSKLPVAPRVTDSSRVVHPGGAPNLVEPGEGSGIMLFVCSGQSAYDVAADSAPFAARAGAGGWLATSPRCPTSTASSPCSTTR